MEEIVNTWYFIKSGQDIPSDNADTSNEKETVDSTPALSLWNCKLKW